MIRMTWRQHRLQLLVGAALVIGLAGYLLLGAWQRAGYADDSGLSRCLAGAASTCGDLASDFVQHFGGVPGVFALLIVLPLLAGLFWGAPLVAREMETGTYRLAWTQSVGRERWLTTKLVAFLAAAVLAGVAVSLSFSAWMSIMDKISDAGLANMNRMEPPSFDLTGIVPVGATLFAFALGTAAGAFIHRTVPAMAVTLGGFLAVTLSLQSLRYHFLPPLTLSGPYATASPLQPGAYVLSSGYSDAAGHAVSFNDFTRACGQPTGNGFVVSVKCLAAKGFRVTEVYQPGDRYWTFQFIETAILVGAAVVLLALAFWRTTGRPALKRR